MSAVQFCLSHRAGRLILVLAIATIAAIIVLGRSRWRATLAVPIHGIGFANECNWTTSVDSYYRCHFVVSNDSDTADDTLTLTSIAATANNTGGPAGSGNLLPSARLNFTGGASCNSGQTLCTLPAGASITTDDIALDGVGAADVKATPPAIIDSAVLTWQDTCSGGASNCPVGDQIAKVGLGSTVQTLTPSATTETPTPTPTSTSTSAPTSTSIPTSTPSRTPAGAQGCTSAFWKNHPAAWPAGVSPSQKVSSVFVGVGPSLAGATLLQALGFQGGPDLVGAESILLRAGVAALLNAADPFISYPLTMAQVTSQVNTALASGNRNTFLALATTLDGDNNLDCPINAFGTPSPD